MGGIEREVDKLGRVVIPIEIRRKLGIEFNSKVSVFLDGEIILISAVKSQCALCGNKIDGKRKLRVCDICVSKIKSDNFKL